MTLLDACLLTNALHLLFKIGHVLAFGDPEVKIGIICLVHVVLRIGGANAEDHGSAGGVLGWLHLFLGGEGWWMEAKGKVGALNVLNTQAKF